MAGLDTKQFALKDNFKKEISPHYSSESEKDGDEQDENEGDGYLDVSSYK